MAPSNKKYTLDKSKPLARQAITPKGNPKFLPVRLFKHPPVWYNYNKIIRRASRQILTEER